MREIKFRAWDEENKTWRYGHFFETVEGIRRCYNIAENREIKYYVNNSSLGQFTGLHDKNGKEIYEGDIVKYEADKESGIAIIEYWPGSFIFNWIKQTTPSPSIIDSAFYFGCHSELEVIGNIHENPELIGGER